MRTTADRSSIRWATVTLGEFVAAAVVAPARGRIAEPPPDPVRVHWDVADADGRLSGGVVLVPASSATTTIGTGGPPAWETIRGGGDPAHRLDVTFVGDGFTEAELGAYAERVEILADVLLAHPPFDRYAPLIAVHRVDVVSAESGVDNDPKPGVERDTALDMAFWCSGIEQLLCVNTAKARLLAGVAPGRDLVIAVANADRYGGAGYPGLTTCSSDHKDSGPILVHEVGHSLGGLADEYFSPGVWDGPEPAEPNVSTLDPAAMASAGTKWEAWLGEPAPGADGPVGGFEGGNLVAEGIYRPTGESLMRSLGRPFNPPSLEALVLAIHDTLDPVEDATPPGPLDGTETLIMAGVPVWGPPLDVRWTVDGMAVPGGPDGSLDLSLHGPPSGTFDVAATVIDLTSFVRDEAARLERMSGARTWTVERAEACVADLDDDGIVGAADLVLLLSGWGTEPGPADIDGDGTIGSGDLVALLSRWGAC